MELLRSCYVEQEGRESVYAKEQALRLSQKHLPHQVSSMFNLKFRNLPRSIQDSQASLPSAAGLDQCPQRGCSSDRMVSHCCL